MHDWTEIQDANREYQSKLDEVRSILMKELTLTEKDFYEIPAYYWPKSMAPQAKSMFPNMINNLYLAPIMIAPKPFLNESAGADIFENYFRSQIPTSVKVYFVNNWSSYYLLDGDVNCGTNTRRKMFSQPWWMHRPEGAYDL